MRLLIILANFEREFGKGVGSREGLVCRWDVWNRLGGSESRGLGGAAVSLFLWVSGTLDAGIGDGHNCESYRRR